MIRYRERTGGPRAWGLLLGACAVAWLVLWWMNDLGWVFPTVLVGMLGGIAALTLWSVDVYGAIVLTDDELRVGRDRIPLADILPASVVGPEEGPTTGGPLAGGAYAPTLGSGTVHLVRRDARTVRIASRDPQALLQELRSALS